MHLTNARWLGQDGTWHKGCISIQNSRIVSISDEPDCPKSSEPTLDCKDLLIFPGAIDGHVHFREPGSVSKEGIENGSRAALAGGVTTVLDMPNTIPPCHSREEFDAKRHLFSQKAPVNWGLFFDVNAPESARAWAREQRPLGKLYMAKSSPSRPVNDVPSIARIFSDFPMIALHAEDENYFVPTEKLHHCARPRGSVLAALATISAAWELADPKPRLLLCHIATADEIRWVQNMRDRSADIVAETCPHYLLLTQEDYLAQGAIYKVNPPLRTEADRSALLEALRDGTIDILSTDHAPHLPAEKASDQPPSGIAGIEWYYPLALHIAQHAELSWRRLHELVCGGASRAFGIEHRNGIAVGNFADLTILEETTAKSDRVITKAGTRPFAHIPIKHEIRHVFVNGNHVFSNGTFFAYHRAKEVLNAH